MVQYARMLFNPKHRKKIQAIWIVVCILMIASMILFSLAALI